MDRREFEIALAEHEWFRCAADLAQFLSWDESKLSRILNGRRTPSFEEKKNISSALNRVISELFPEEEGGTGE